MEKLLTACVFFLAFTACSDGGESGAAEQRVRGQGLAPIKSQESGTASSINLAQEPAVNLSGQSRKLLMDGNIRIQVENYKNERDTIVTRLEKFGGYLASENESKQSYRLSNQLTLRVPSAHFDALMDAIAERAEQVIQRNVSVRDVTQEYYDLELRIRNKKELEKRYLDILSKAGSVKEILEIEATLNEVRTAIESMEGSLKLLNSQVRYSTIHLTISQILEYKYEPAPSPGFSDRIVVAFQAGWNGFLRLLVGLVHLWPLFLLSALIVVIILKWNNKKQRKNHS